MPSSPRLASSTCKSFVSAILLPVWNDRSRVISYCSEVAKADDGSDPERGVREAEQRKKENMVVNERLDPYSARFEVRESRQDRLKRAVREEWEIEGIVRDRSWVVLRTRCEAVTGEWNNIAPIPDDLNATNQLK